MDSVWMDGDTATHVHPPLSGSGQVVDTIVIGGGITGTMTALLLAQAGQSVALLEARGLGGGNTAGSTGNLYGTLSSGLSPLRTKWDDTVMRDVVAARLRAVTRIEQTVADFAIDCAFARRPLHWCISGGDSSQLEWLEGEFDANADAGLAPQWADSAFGPALEFRRALRIDGQAQFNPYRFVHGLGNALAKLGVRMHEHSAVIDIDASEGLVTTKSGSLRGRNIVFATHTPKGFNLVQAEMEVYREYGISTVLAAGAEPPEGIVWVRDDERSLRSGNDAQELVVVGEKHKTGIAEAGVDYHQRLEDYARAHFDVTRCTHRWSAQQYRPADGLPYIGRSAHDNVFIATGFAADGLTWGAVAAELIADLVQGRDTHMSELLSPRRFTPVKSAKAWAEETATVVKHLVGDSLTRADKERFDEVPAGAGQIIDIAGRKHAVYRSAEGALSVLSPICPHLKCHVSWNAASTSWDCPCHGSRFDTSGAILEGPALQPLERFELE